MIVAIPAIAKVAAKILSVLLGDKKGRKFLLYTVCIALFIVLLPVIAVYGLFGWMVSGNAGELINYDMVYNQMPSEYQEIMQQYDNELNQITVTFTANGLNATDVSMAKTIYVSCLVGKETEENFYQKYADCFLGRTEESGLLQNISSAFGVSFSDADREKLNQLYGGSI